MNSVCADCSAFKIFHGVFAYILALESAFTEFLYLSSSTIRS